MVEPRTAKKPSAEELAAKNEGKLKELATSKGMLKTENGGQMVNVARMNEEYLRQYYFPQHMDVRLRYQDNLEHGGRGEVLIPFQDFLQIYKDHAGQNKRITPQTFLVVAYDERKFKTRVRGVSAGASVDVYKEGGNETKDTIPIKVDALGGRPKLQSSVFYAANETGEQDYKISTGVQKYDSKPVEPFVEGQKGGFWANKVLDSKKAVVGLGESVFSLSREFGEKTATFFSATVGPWMARFNFAAHKFTAGFSGLIFVFELFEKGIERLIGQKYQKAALFKDTQGVKLEDIKEGTVLRGVNAKNAPAEITVKKVGKKADEQGYLTIKATDGKSYKVQKDGGELYIYEKIGFWRRMRDALNPIKIAKDIVEIAFVGPWKKLKDFADSFRAPEKKELTLEEIKKKDAELQGAISRGNNNTARRIAQLLVDNTSGIKKAEYMLTLDRVEWGIANAGLFFGYIKGMGFGNKKKMVKEDIGKRIHENLAILKRTRERMAAGELSAVREPEYIAALAYIKQKAAFQKSRDGQLLPTEPMPESVASEMFAEEGRHDVPSEENIAAAEAKARTGRMVEGVDFTRITPPTELGAGKTESWARMNALLQAMYGKLGDKALLGPLNDSYSLMKDSEERAKPFEEAMRGMGDEDYRLVFFNAATERLAGRLELPKTEDAAKMSKEKLMEYYTAIMRS